MIISIIQDRPIEKFNGDYYMGNFSDIIKYGKLCDHLFYCCSIVEVDSEEKIKGIKKIDMTNVSIQEVIKSPLKELFHTSSFNKRQVVDVVTKADLVVIKCPSITLGKWAFDYVRKINKKYILEYIACAWDSYWYHDIRGKIMAPYSYYNAKRMAEKAHNVIYVTSKFLQSRYPTGGNSIACSNVVLMDMHPGVLLSRLDKINNATNYNRLKLGTVGAVNVAFKGQQYVIEALYKLKKKGFIYDYFLAGGGDNNRLKSMVMKFHLEDQVHFVGVISKEKMNDFYDSLDIYVHPSLAEGLPRVVIEAESRALPACGANAAGTPELLETDFIFRKQDSDDICRVLLRFTKERMLEQSRANYNRAAEYMLDVLDARRQVFYKKALE